MPFNPNEQSVPRFSLSNRSEAPSRYNRIIRISVVQPMNSHAWWPSRCSHGSGDNLRSLVTIYVLYSFYFNHIIRISAVQPMFNPMLGGPLDVRMLAVTFFTLYSFYCFIRISAVQPMNSHAWWPSRCSHASGDNPHTLCTNITLDCTNITLDRIDALSITTVLVRGKRCHGRSYLIA